MFFILTPDLKNEVEFMRLENNVFNRKYLHAAKYILSRFSPPPHWSYNAALLLRDES